MPRRCCTSCRAVGFALGSRIVGIFIAIALGAALSAALLLAFSRQSTHQQLVEDQPISYWLKCLDSGDEALRFNATRNLPQFGAAALRPLIDRLDAPDPAVASSASAALSTIGPSAAGELARCLASGSPARRTAAVELLRTFTPAV